MLTKKQNQLLRYIHKRLKQSGVSPSYEEMKDELNLRSKSGIHRLIVGLEERGFLRRLPNRARSLEVTRLPEIIVDALSDHNSPNYTSPVVPASNTGKTRSKKDSNLNNRELTVPVPVMGKIAAGVPIEAIQNESHTMTVPENFLTGGEHFALGVEGDSMIDAGIFDGDTVLIRKGNTAVNGDIVVALVDNEEATLKRFRKKGDSIALEAANKAYETRIYRPDSVAIQGTLVGLYRQYH